jgi:competence protein ComEA
VIVSDGSLRERLGTLSRAELVGLVLLLAISLGGAGLWYVRSLPKPVQVRADHDPAVAMASGSPTPSPALLLVDVAGWVRRPGVYEFHEGDRVIDAIDAAGGARPGAALESLNLAAPLTDGTQILVPKQNAAPVASSAPGTTATGTTAKVNVNTGSSEELQTLPGIGEVLAQNIIDYRTQNGPFASIDDLVEVSGIGDVTLSNIEDLVTV